jgi:hypothetical protein
MTDMTRPTRSGPAALVRIVMPIGISMPPPRPCSTRNRISDSTDHAMPASAEPAMNRNTAVR